MNFLHIWRTSCDNFEVALAEAAPQQLLPLYSSSSSTWRVQRWRSKRRTNWTQNEGEISTTVCFSAFFPGTRFNFTLFQHCREEESHGKRDMWRGSDPKRRLLQTSWLWQLFTANPQRHFGWTGELKLYIKMNWLSKLNLFHRFVILARCLQKTVPQPFPTKLIRPWTLWTATRTHGGNHPPFPVVPNTTKSPWLLISSR